MKNIVSEIKNYSDELTSRMVTAEKRIGESVSLNRGQ